MNTVTAVTHAIETLTDRKGPKATPRNTRAVKDQADPIKERTPLPNGMEFHLFTTTDGWGIGQFDVEAGQYVDGSIVRFSLRRASPFGAEWRRFPLPNGMEFHLFTTTDGWGIGQYDVKAGQYVDGSIVRFTGPDAEGKARESIRRRVAQILRQSVLRRRVRPGPRA